MEIFGRVVTNTSFSRVLLLSPVREVYVDEFNRRTLEACLDLIKNGVYEVALLPPPDEQDFCNALVAKSFGEDIKRHVRLADPDQRIHAQVDEIRNELEEDVLPRIDLGDWDSPDVKNFLGELYCILAALRIRAELPISFSWFLGSLTFLIDRLEEAKATGIPAFERLVLLRSAVSLYQPVEVDSCRFEAKESMAPFGHRIREVLSSYELSNLANERANWGWVGRTMESIQRFAEKTSEVCLRYRHLEPVVEEIKVLNPVKNIARHTFFGDYAPPIIDLGSFLEYPPLPGVLIRRVKWPLARGR